MAAAGTRGTKLQAKRTLVSFTPWNPPPPSLCRWGGGLEQTRKSLVSPSSLSQYFIESMALASADVSQRCDNGKCVSGVVVKRETLRRDGRRQSNNGVHWPRKREKSWLVVSRVALSSLCVIFFFFNITLFPFFPAARPLPSLRKLSSPPPPAKVNSQPVCRNIGGGRFGGGGGRVLSPALHSQPTAHTSRRRRRRSERHRREARRDDIMRAPCLGSCYPLLQTIRIIIFLGRVGPREETMHCICAGQPARRCSCGLTQGSRLIVCWIFIRNRRLFVRPQRPRI